MAMSGSVIDLGLLPAADAEREPPAPARPHRRHWAPHHSYWAAALTALVLLLTGASAAPPPSWPTPHFTLTVNALTGGIYLTEDLLLVAARNTDQQTVFTAYRLADGAVQWQAEGVDGYVWEGVPVLWRSGTDGTWQTFVLDPATGQVVWQGEGGLAGMTADRLVIVQDQAERPPEADDLRWPLLRLEIVDRASGEVLLRLDRVRQWAISDQRPGPATLVIAADGQPVTSYDLTSGEPVAASPAVELHPGGALTVAGDVLLVQPQGARPDYIAYDARTLTERWRGDPGSQIWSVRPCGPVLCIHDSQLAAVDPVTGERLWSGRRFSSDRYVAYQPGPPWPSEYLVVEQQDRFLAQRLPMALVRATTGEVLAEFPGWMPPTSTVSRMPVGTADEWARHTEPILQRYVPEPAARGDDGPDARPQPPPAAPREPGRNPVPLGRTWFARLHFDPMRLELLGSVESGLYGCQALGDYVACAEVESVRVWRTA